MVLAYRTTVASPVQVLTKSPVAHQRQVARSIGVKAEEVAQHRPEPRAHQIGPLGKQPLNATAAVFQCATAEGDRETHLGWHGRHTKVVEEGDEVRVGVRIAHNEPGIHGNVAITCVDLQGVAMASHTGVGLVYGHVMRSGQQPCR